MVTAEPTLRTRKSEFKNDTCPAVNTAAEAVSGELIKKRTRRVYFGMDIAVVLHIRARDLA